MEIKSFQFIKKQLLLKKKIFLDGNFISEREIIIIKIETDNNIIGIGEAVILESHGTESAKELNSALEFLTKNIFDFRLNNSFTKNTSLFNLLTNTPSLRSAVEQAVFNICLQSNTEETIKLFNLNSHSSIKLNCLIPAVDQKEKLSVIQKKYDEGFRVFKIKTSFDSVEKEIAILKEIIRTFPDIKLRIDPNGKWKYEDLINNISFFENPSIEYIEQPFLKKDQLISLQKETTSAIAADESATSFVQIKKLINSGIKTIILKPITVGGITNSLGIIKLANVNNVDLIITSSFESMHIIWRYS